MSGARERLTLPGRVAKPDARATWFAAAAHRACKATVQPGLCDACGEPLGDAPALRMPNARPALVCERCAGEQRAHVSIRLAPDAGTLADVLQRLADTPWAQPHLAEIGWRIALWRAGLS